MKCSSTSGCYCLTFEFLVENYSTFLCMSVLNGAKLWSVMSESSSSDETFRFCKTHTAKNLFLTEFLCLFFPYKNINILKSRHKKNDKKILKLAFLKIHQNEASLCVKYENKWSEITIIIKNKNNVYESNYNRCWG